jgi:Fucosyltransferase, N-terminal
MTVAEWRTRFFRLTILMAFMFMFLLMDLPKMGLEGEIPSKADSLLSKATTILTEKLGLTTNTKTILLWTTFFKSADFSTGYGNTVFKDCPYSNCETTSDRGLLPKSSAVVFHAYNIDVKDLPESRTSDQRWVFFNKEPPYYLPKTLRNTSNLFNWTMTYR